MNQFYASPEQIRGNVITLVDQEATHASKVMRKQPGDEIRITDGLGGLYLATVKSTKKNELQAEIQEKKTYQRPPGKVVLCMGLIRKRDRLEFAVEKATELGVTGIYLFQADHTEPFRVRMDRVEMAVHQAMKQSLRLFMPEVKQFKSLDEILDKTAPDSVIIQASQDADDLPGKEMHFNSNDLYLIVGPEGGLSDREEKLLLEKEAKKITLGDFRLRAETAAIVMSSMYCLKIKKPGS